MHNKSARRRTFAGTAAAPFNSRVSRSCLSVIYFLSLALSLSILERERERARETKRKTHCRRLLARSFDSVPPRSSLFSGSLFFPLFSASGRLYM